MYIDFFKENAVTLYECFSPEAKFNGMSYHY